MELMLASMGIMSSGRETHVDRMNQMLAVYLHCQDQMPSFAWEYLQAKSRIEIDIASVRPHSEALWCQERLRDLYEQSCVHIRPRRFHVDLQKCLKSELKHLRPAKIWTHDKNAIVRAGGLGDIALLLAHLQGPDFQYVVPSVVKVINTHF